MKFPLRLPARRSLAIPLVLAGAAALFFWPIWLANYTYPKGGGDLWGQIYPVWSYVSQWLRRGVFPIWDTNIMGGDPILGEAQYGLFHPLNWPLFLFSPIPQALIALRSAAALWLAGLGMAVYLRRSPVWRLSRSAALIGALAYMFADPFIAHLGHPQFNDALAWLPWTLWGVDAAARSRRGIPWAGLGLALILLAGHGQASLYSALAVGAYSLWQIFEGGREKAPHRLGRLILVALLAAAIAAPALLPGLERLPYSDRAAVAEEARYGYEFPIHMLIDFLSPNYHGRGVDRFWPSWDRVESGYAGAVTLYLAGLGLLSQLRKRRTWFLIGLGTLTLLFSLGYHGPLYPLLARLPLFADSWKTSRVIFLLSWVLAVGAALGLETLQHAARRRGIHAWAIGLALFGLGLALMAPTLAAPVPAGTPQELALQGLRFAALLAGLTALAGLPFISIRKAARAALPLLLLVELVALGARVEAKPRSTAPNPHNAALAFLKSDTGWFRVDVDAAARGLWSPAGLLADGFEVPQGNGNPMEIAAYNRFYWGIPHKGAPAYRLLGAKYIIVPKDALPGGEGIWPAFTNDPLIDIHLNTHSLNRIWFVYRTIPVTDLGKAGEVIFKEDFAPDQVATVENGPELNGSGQPIIDGLDYTPNRIVVDVRTDAPALLVISDILYPGWTARLDGVSTPIYRTDGIYRGVVIPAGSHHLEMNFFPVSLRWGLGLLSCAGLVFIYIFARRLRRAKI